MSSMNDYTEIQNGEETILVITGKFVLAKKTMSSVLVLRMFLTWIKKL